MKIKALITLLCIQFYPVVAAQAETLNLSVAASMTDVFKEMITDFTARHTDAKIQPNYASSGSLAKQIEQGAPSDIFVSANSKWMNYLIEKHLVAAGTDQILAFNHLVFVGSKRTGSLSLADLTGLERIALGSPQNVPAGQYAKQALEHAGIYAALEQTKKLIMAKDVRQALIYADRGEVDGAFVYKTDALLATQVQILFTVPEDHYDRITYPMALTMTGAKSELAQAFYRYMSSAEAQILLIKYGFEPNR